MDFTTIVIAIISSGLINTLLNYFISSKEKKKSENSSVLRGLRIIMKDRLRCLCVHYIQQGWIYEDELEDLIAMHKLYHDDFHGNGFLDELMDRIKSLEIRGIGVK